MDIRKTSAVVVLWAAAFAVTSAQSFNPRVEVTNTYRGKLVEVQKAEVPMAMPDSLLHFDYRVDYAVFDHPYKGSYEFHPYLIEMKPEVSRPSSSRLYLNAGAGYLLSPVLDFAWSPRPSGGFSGVVYDDFKGWYGPMRGGFATGYDGSMLRNRLGATGHFEGKGFNVVADAGYGFLHAGDSAVSHSFHAVDFSIGGGTAHDPFRKVNVHGDFGVSYGHDAFGSELSDGFGVRELAMNAGLGLTVPHRHYPGNLWAVDLAIESVRLSGGIVADGLMVSASPKYVISRDALRISLGVKLSALPGSGGRDASEPYHVESDYLYPDMHAEYLFNKGRTALFAHLTGGNRLDRYATLLELNPYSVFGGDGVNASVTRADLNLGLRGCAFKRLEYRAGWGYAVYDGILNEDCLSPGTPMFVYSEHTTTYSDVSLAWKGRRLDMTSELRYSHSFNGLSGLKPAALTGRFDLGCRCTERLTASLRGKGSGKRVMSGGAPGVPAWFDLGVRGEYQFSSGLSFWVDGGNLLCRNIYEYAWRARKGVQVSVGLCLNIR